MLGEKGTILVEAKTAAAARVGKTFESFKASAVLMQGALTVVGTSSTKEFDVINVQSSDVSVGDLVLVTKTIQGFIVTTTGGDGGNGSQVIEFSILDPSSSSSTATASSSVDEGLCANQVYDAPASVMASVTRRPCGVTTVYGEDGAGNVEVHDRLSSFLFERSLADVIGKKGIAVLMSANAGDEGVGSGSTSSSVELPCEWVIIWIDWFRLIRVQTNTIVGADRITFSYKNVKVWDDCKLANEVVIGADCDTTASTSSTA